MKAEITCEGKYVRVGAEMIFPNPGSGELAEIEWKMRYAPISLTKKELLYAASVIDAYREIALRKTLANRNKVCSSIKRACTESK